MKFSISTLFITSVFLLPGLGTGCNRTETNQSVADEMIVSLDSLFQREAEAGRFSGTVAIGSHDTLLYNTAWGIADRTFDIPMEINFRFDIASVNKSMVGALVMVAVNEQKLSTDDRITDLLDGFEYRGAFNDSITVHQMLTHTSGLADYDGVSEELASNNFRAFKRLNFSNSEYVDFISRLEPIAEPGKYFHYSNFAYHLLCIILEEIYEMPFGELLKKKITEPLEMINTYSTTDNKAIIKNEVEAYSFADGKWKENEFIDLTIGRRVFSTAEDLYKWGRAMNDTTFLPVESLEKMTTNHLKMINKDISYGYGWVVYGGSDSFEMGKLPTDLPYIIHGGSTEGFKSMVVNINEGEWIISILANSGSRAGELTLAQSVSDILLTKSSLKL